MGEFAKKFGEALKARGLTQVQASEMLGISQSMISAYTSGKRVPPARTIEFIENRLRDPNGNNVNVIFSDKPTVFSASKSQPKLPSSKLKEGAIMYRLDDSDCDDRIVWINRIRERWIRYPQEQPKIELAIRTALPDDADRVLDWLRRRH